MKLDAREIQKQLSEDIVPNTNSKFLEKRAAISHRFDDGTNTKGQDSKKKFHKKK